MADVSVRAARAIDAERVARVQLSTWRTAYGGLLPPGALDVPEVQAAAIWLGAVESPPSPRHRLLVAFEREELVGFAASGPVDDEHTDERQVELLSLLVEPRWGRRGHGSRLLAASVEHWRADGAERAMCWLFARDTASLSFLRGAGWEPDGAGRGLVTITATGGDADDVQRQLRLHTDLRTG